MVEILPVLLQLTRRAQVVRTARGLKIDTESVRTKPGILLRDRLESALSNTMSSPRSACPALGRSWPSKSPKSCTDPFRSSPLEPYPTSMYSVQSWRTATYQYLNQRRGWISPPLDRFSGCARRYQEIQETDKRNKGKPRDLWDKRRKEKRENPRSQRNNT